MEDDRRAVSAALALWLYLAALKLRLAWWWIAVKGVHPLSDLSAGASPLVAASDLALCAGLAVVFAVLRRWGRPGAALAAAASTGAAVFSLASLKVSEVYGTPLVIQHLTGSFGSLYGMSDSLAFYATPATCALLAGGVFAGLYGPRLLAPALARIRVLRTRSRLWAALLVPAAAASWAASARLRGIYTYGLKHDAVIEFALSARDLRPRRELDAAAALRAVSPAAAASDALYRAFAPIGAIAAVLPRGLVTPPRPKGLNVVFVMIESASGVYLDAKTTPRLMELAGRGVLFARHFTTVSVSYKALYSMFYSDYLVELGAYPREVYRRALPQPSLASVLSGHGYATAYFASSYIDYQDVGYLLDGFGVRVGADTLRARGGATWAWGVHEEQTVAAASEWVRAHKDGPFFLFYETMFPHHPYLCPLDVKPYPVRDEADRYRNALYYADRNIGALVDALEREGVRDRTLIVVVGDHGETVGGGQAGHGIAVSMSELRVPLILSGPGLGPSVVRRDLFTNHLDLAPTVAGLVGIAAPPEWLGRDLSTRDVAPRTFEVTLEQSRQSVLIDQGLVYSLDRRADRAELRRMDGDRLLPLSPDDPLRRLAPRYQDALAHFEDWVRWRHFARAAHVPETAAK